MSLAEVSLREGGGSGEAETWVIRVGKLWGVISGLGLGFCDRDWVTWGESWLE